MRGTWNGQAVSCRRPHSRAHPAHPLAADLPLRANPNSVGDGLRLGRSVGAAFGGLAGRLLTLVAGLFAVAVAYPGWIYVSTTSPRNLACGAPATSMATPRSRWIFSMVRRKASITGSTSVIVAIIVRRAAIRARSRW